ncbi:prenyltransferase/squalene oxidase repeat-containing protein [Crossiella cryophila]|uniref:Uncharacterized protein n=1 Tax=Crossiella cryophila TaxID=43355 RepID=A0A7W7FUC9_9PSEU|nr:prenyltransferase/squalene oxidase repeat-containing protein [Crossiella cryophila]MBB4677318.1 hypothetical protein [Crossiella cryophila]
MNQIWRRALSAFAGAALLLSMAAPLAAAAPAPIPGSPGYCPDGNGVTVVVDFQELGGATEIRCAPGDQASGLTALENSGFVVEGTRRWGKAFICRIQGKPGVDTEACINTPPANAYWSYWHAPNGGSWAYSTSGVTGRKPPLGSFEGWSFSKDKTGSTNPPPRVAPVRPAATAPRTEPKPDTRSAPKTDDVAAGGPEASRWLAGFLKDGLLPGVIGPEMPDHGLTLDALFALVATKTDPAAQQRMTGALERSVLDYIGNPWGGNPNERQGDQTAKALLGAVAAGVDPTDFGGVDLRQETLNLIAGADAGAFAGELRDRDVQPKSETNLFGQSFAVLGLARSGGVPQPVVDFLVKQQCAAGGFRLSWTSFGATGARCDEDPKAVLDPDSTGMAVQALLTAARSGSTGAADAATKGLNWLESKQDEAGGIGGSGPTAPSNTNSTGLGGQALAAGGRTKAAERAAEFVRSHQLTKDNGGKAGAQAGGIAWNRAQFEEAVKDGFPELPGAQDSWRRATAQALLTLAGVPLGELGPEVPDAGPNGKLAKYLTGKLVNGDHVEVTAGGQSFVDYGQTADVAYGLLLSGRQPSSLTKVLAFLDKKDSVEAYTQGKPFDKPGARYAGATAKLAFLFTLAGKNPRAVGGIDLIDQLSGLLGDNGRFADISEFGNNANTFGQSFGILALTAVGDTTRADKAATALAAARCKDATVPVGFPAAEGCATGTADATGLALQALNAVPKNGGALSPDRKTALTESVRALEKLRQGNGSWIGPGGENVNSTAYATMGLLGVRQDAKDSRAWLLSLQRQDGGLPLNPGAESNLLASAQALPATAGKSFLSKDNGPVKPAERVARPADPKPEPKPNDPPPNDPNPGPGTDPGPAPQPQYRPAALARTGAEVSETLLAGALLLGAGAAMVVLTRRRRAA